MSSKNLKVALASIAANTGSQMVVENFSADLFDDEVYEYTDFPFGNLVFEGGGNKGMAYVGAIEVMWM